MDINYFDSVQRVKREYTRVLEPICSAWSLTRNEIDVLLFLYNNPELNRAADIVNHRGIAKSHVSLSVNTLEEKGLINRMEHPADRRTIRLELTERGNQIAEQARIAQKKFLDALYCGITKEELAIWRKIARKIEDNIKHFDFS